MGVAGRAASVPILKGSGKTYKDGKEESLEIRSVLTRRTIALGSSIHLGRRASHVIPLRT